MKPNMFAYLYKSLIATVYTCVCKYHLGTLLCNQPEQVDALQCRTTKLATPPLDSDYHNRLVHNDYLHYLSTLMKRYDNFIARYQIIY